MRPQSFDCGWSRLTPLHPVRLSCFNEAAVFRLRMAPSRSQCAPESARFNEAAVFRLRMEGGARERRPGACAASMRPQSFDCGWRSSGRPSPSLTTCFNEAAVFRLRMGRAASGAGRPRAASFNEAAVFRLRMGGPRPPG